MINNQPAMIFDFFENFSGLANRALVFTYIDNFLNQAVLLVIMQI